MRIIFFKLERGDPPPLMPSFQMKRKQKMLIFSAKKRRLKDCFSADSLISCPESLCLFKERNMDMMTYENNLRERGCFFAFVIE
jgi:hypothetical protein